MGLKSLLKKASMTLGGLLLAGNIGCNSVKTFSNYDYINTRPKNLESKLENKRPIKLKKWQYPVNILGGFMTQLFVHESGHALVGLAQGLKIKEFHPYPGHIEYDATSEFHGGYVRWHLNERFLSLSPQEHALRNIAGPVANIVLNETINYNLRKGNIAEEYQSFWATTSLISRGTLFAYAIDIKDDSKSNDFKNFEKNTGISRETMAGLVSLYTILNAKRIKKELNVALGKDIYPVKEKRRGIFDIFPTHLGVNLNYTLNF